MSKRRNRSLRALLEAGPQLGIGVMYPASGIIEHVGSDWDWIWVDGQHGEFGYGDILGAVRAANLVGRPAVVRVPGFDGGAIGKALDTAADAVMVPMVEDAEQARRLVQAAKFPPVGSRSFGGRRPVDVHGRGYANPDHEQPLLICQIESPAGVAHAEAIAAVEGVDVLFFGPDDMALQSGWPMDKPVPEGTFDEAMGKVAAAAASCGKFSGCVFGTPEKLRSGVAMGYRLIACTADVVLLWLGSQEKARVMREALGGEDVGA